MVRAFNRSMKSTGTVAATKSCCLNIFKAVFILRILQTDFKVRLFDQIFYYISYHKEFIRVYTADFPCSEENLKYNFSFSDGCK